MPPFRPERFREIAEKIHGGNVLGSSETRHRLVAGRCYYASYLSVCVAMYAEHKVSSGIRYPKHWDLSQELAKKGKGEIKDIGLALVDLLARRHHADYELNVEMLEDDADDSIADAQRLAKLLTADVIKRLPLLTGDPK